MTRNRPSKTVYCTTRDFASTKMTITRITSRVVKFSSFYITIADDGVSNNCLQNIRHSPSAIQTLPPPLVTPRIALPVYSPRSGTCVSRSTPPSATNDNDCAVIPRRHPLSPPPRGENRLRVCLRYLADNRATNARICKLALWQSTSSSTAISTRIDGHNEEQEEPMQKISSSQSLDAFSQLRRDGFIVRLPPKKSSRRDTMRHLSTTMDHIENAGYPPVFCFMNDAFWDFVTDEVWPAVSSLFGAAVDNNKLCLLDAGSAFAWSLKANGKSTFPRDGEFRS